MLGAGDFQPCSVGIGNAGTERQPDAAAACGPAAGLVYTEEGLKDTLLIFLRNSPSRIGNKDQKLFGLLGDADLYRTVWTSSTTLS